MGNKLHISGINVAGERTAVFCFHAKLARCFIDHRKEGSTYPQVSEAGSPLFTEVCAKRLCIVGLCGMGISGLEENSRNSIVEDCLRIATSSLPGRHRG